MMKSTAELVMDVRQYLERQVQGPKLKEIPRIVR